MAKDKLQTDEIVSFANVAWNYMQQNIRQLSAIGLVVCLIVAGIVFWSVKQSNAEKTAMSLLNDAMSNIGSYSKNPVDREMKNSRALEGFQNINSSYSSTIAGSAALFYSGVCSYNLKKYDEAIAFYENFLKSGEGALKYLKSSAFEGIGYAYEEKGEYEKALEFYEKQKKHGQNEINSTAFLNLARCYEASGDTEKACQSYERFIETNPSSFFKDVALVKKNSICGNGGTR